MRAVLQRATSASVRVDGSVVGALDRPGLVVLVGVSHHDTPAAAAQLADKVWNLRIFTDRHRVSRPGNLPEHHAAASVSREVSAADIDAPILVISQFTLYAETAKGRRPTWDRAAPRLTAEPLLDAVVVALRERGATVATGIFGADMAVDLVNDGPMTILIDTDS